MEVFHLPIQTIPIATTMPSQDTHQSLTQCRILQPILIQVR